MKLSRHWTLTAVLCLLALGLIASPWVSIYFRHQATGDQTLKFSNLDDDPFKGCFQNPVKAVAIPGSMTFFDKDDDGVPECVREGEKEFALVKTQGDADALNSTELNNRRLNRKLRQCPDGTEDLGTIEKDEEGEMILVVCGKPEYGSYRSLEKYKKYQAVFNKRR